MTLQLFKALADETRMRITNILFKNELSVNELVQILGMGQSRVSRHLKILSEAGILQSRRDGLWVFYSSPEHGLAKDFLEVIMPFIPNTEQLKNDLKLAQEILEERSLKTRQFFNNIAENWDNLNHDILGEYNLADTVAKHLPSNCKTAVDLGCGTGEVLAVLLEHGMKVIGVDGSAKMLAMCRARLLKYEQNPSLSLRIGELNHLPLADHEADFACINLVMHHLHNPDEIFPEIWRILAPGATFFIADFLRHNDESMRIHYGDHWLGLDPEIICKNILANGFKDPELKIQPVGHNLSLFMIKTNKPDNL